MKCFVICWCQLVVAFNIKMILYKHPHFIKTYNLWFSIKYMLSFIFSTLCKWLNSPEYLGLEHVCFRFWENENLWWMPEVNKSFIKKGWTVKPLDKCLRNKISLNIFLLLPTPPPLQRASRFFFSFSKNHILYPFWTSLPLVLQWLNVKSGWLDMKSWWLHAHYMARCPVTMT